MKILILSLFFYLLLLPNVYSQVSDFKSKDTVDTEIDILLYPNPTQDILYFDSKHTIEYVKLFDQEGKIVFQIVPEDNQISLKTLQSGFYLFCAYINGVKVKKGILKKV